MGDPEALNTHAHSEQAQFPKGRFSTQISLRSMSSLSRLAIRLGTAHSKNIAAPVFERDGEGKAGYSSPEARFRANRGCSNAHQDKPNIRAEDYR
jgi:hypothetical protein